MPVLTLYADKNKLESFQLKPDKPLTIGRLESNTIVLDDPAVSSYHAEIENDGKHYFITDYQSRNGTFVNKELVISRQLAHGDQITINPYTIVFGYQHGEENEARDPEITQATMHLDTSDHRSRLARSLSELAGQEQRGRQMGCLEFLSEDRPLIFLSNAVTRIGKSRTSDIVVKGLMIGHKAAEIIASDERYTLCFIGGTRKPRVNYQPVAGEVVLNEFDIIEIGSVSMQFHYRKAGDAGGSKQQQQTQEIEMDPTVASNDENKEGG